VIATVTVTDKYEADSAELLPPDERDRLEFTIACDPEAHPVIPNTGGVRKARWVRPGMGKRGGVRVIYYYAISAEIILMLAIYAKNRKENLSSAEEKTLRKTVQEFQEEITRRGLDRGRSFGNRPS
jgi:mRNA-degrading endonuclease RelE of RelBE toxin-antitoxin system